MPTPSRPLHKSDEIFTGKQFVFIIGAPRSGTTWLQGMLAAHPSICSTIDELKLFDFFTGPLEQGWNSLLDLQKATGGGRHGLAAMWTDEEFYGFLKEFVGRVYAQVAALNPSALVLLDKAPAYSRYVEHIDRLIPQPKFIHVIRDGRDVAASLMSAAQGWGRLWAPKGVRKAASIWKTHVLAAQTARQYESRYFEVRYEELLTNGPEVLRDVFEFVGVAAGQETIEATYAAHRFELMREAGTGARGFLLPKEFFRKGEAGGWRETLKGSDRYAFNEAAGDLLRALGYSDAHWCYERAYQRFTMPFLSMLAHPRRVPAAAVNRIKRVLSFRRTSRSPGNRKKTVEMVGER